MRRAAVVILVLGSVLSLVGCGKWKKAKELPVHEYPLTKETVEAALEKGGLPEYLTVEENDLVAQEGIASASYTLRHPAREVFAGHSMGILSHKAEAFTSLGLTVSTIDQREEFTKEEIEQSICFAESLFWQEEAENRILELFMKEYAEGQPYLFEKEIDGIDCQIAYTPNQRQPKLKVAFSTDMDAQMGNE
ncbi:MAG: hypothetical protein IJC59_03085 [Lachnospiraceae bacterium]|nr:hypothetical protein [Lachnospiraceae bacterium]